jgi:hypothetical protein
MLPLNGMFVDEKTPKKPGPKPKEPKPAQHRTKQPAA